MTNAERIFELALEMGTPDGEGKPTRPPDLAFSHQQVCEAIGNWLSDVLPLRRFDVQIVQDKLTGQTMVGVWYVPEESLQ